MIDWQEVSQRLQDAARQKRGKRLLVLTLPLPRWPAGSLARHSEWHCWHRPDEGCRLVGLGAALRFASADESRFAALATFLDGLRAEADGAPLLAFLGFAFWPRFEAGWPNLQLVVPELLIGMRDGRCFVQFALAREPLSEALVRWQRLWRHWRQPNGAMPPAPHPWQPIAEPLVERAFLARARAALAAIARGEIEKAVLSSQRRYWLAHEVDADGLFERLCARYPHCALYGVRMGGTTFLGASPERLVTLTGDRVLVDALAGTHWRHARRPLADEKNRREHECVAHAIGEALAPLSEEIVVPATSETLHLPGLSHWRRRITARLRAGVTLPELLAALHPTPAVGGAPRNEALSWLSRHGEHRPLWYSGGIGWLDLAGAADLAVALRCARLEKDQATLYAGAGLVAGSEAEDEAAEVAAKIDSLRRALTQGIGARSAA